MARTSSAKKIARLAEKGKGKKVRFQGGSVFPTVVLAVLILGAVLIAYARQGGTAVDATVTAEQKYATAFAFFNCDALATDLKQPDAATLNPADKFAAVTDASTAVPPCRAYAMRTAPRMRTERTTVGKTDPP